MHLRHKWTFEYGEEKPTHQYCEHDRATYRPVKCRTCSVCDKHQVPDPFDTGWITIRRTDGEVNSA